MCENFKQKQCKLTCQPYICACSTYIHKNSRIKPDLTSAAKFKIIMQVFSTYSSLYITTSQFHSYYFIILIIPVQAFKIQFSISIGLLPEELWWHMMLDKANTRLIGKEDKGDSFKKKKLLEKHSTEERWKGRTKIQLYLHSFYPSPKSVCLSPQMQRVTQK